MGCHSLDVDDACGLDVLDKEVAQSDVLRALSTSLLLRLNADVLSVKMWMGDFADVKDFAAAVEVVRLY